MIKCSEPNCARDASKDYFGKGSGRRAPGTKGIPLCEAHYIQVRRRGFLGELRGRGRPKGTSTPAVTRTEVIRRMAVEDCAAIAEFHGHRDLAILLRRLKS